LKHQQLPLQITLGRHDKLGLLLRFIRPLPAIFELGGLLKQTLLSLQMHSFHLQQSVALFADMIQSIRQSSIQ